MCRQRSHHRNYRPSTIGERAKTRWWRFGRKPRRCWRRPRIWSPRRCLNICGSVRRGPCRQSICGRFNVGSSCGAWRMRRTRRSFFPRIERRGARCSWTGPMPTSWASRLRASLTRIYSVIACCRIPIGNGRRAADPNRYCRYARACRPGCTGWARCRLSCGWTTAARPRIGSAGARRRGLSTSRSPRCARITVWCLGPSASAVPMRTAMWNRAMVI